MVGLFRRKSEREKRRIALDKAAAKKQHAVPKETKKAEPEKYEPSAKSALSTDGKQPLDELPRQIDSGSSTTLPKEGNTSGILPTREQYDTWFVDKNHPRLKSIQEQINRMTSQISKASKNMPYGGSFFDEWSGDIRKNMRHNLEAQRRDHAESRLQDLIAKKDNLVNKYDDVLHEIASTKQDTKNTSKTSPLPEYAAKPKPAETRESENNFCDNCGKSLRPTANFCSGCGSKV